MDKIGDAQFRVMCDMWGVDKAIEATRHMKMMPTQEQIETARQKEIATQERWNSVFKKKMNEG